MQADVYKRMNFVEDHHWWYASKRRLIHSLLVNVVGNQIASKKILEIGCCTGGNLKYFSNFVRDLSGLELDAEAVVWAKQKTEGKIDIRQGHLPDAVPFPNASFDVVLMLDVLEHIKEDLGSLKAARMLLKPDGILVLTVPAFSSLWSKNDEVYHHLRRYTLPQLEQLCGDAGFSRILFKNYMNFLLAPVIFIIRFLSDRFRLPGNELAIPGFVINFVLKAIMSSEIVFLKRVKVPFGYSAVLLIRS